MDDLDTSQGWVIEQTLREITRVNELLGGDYVTTTGLRKMIRDWPFDRPIRIVDIGCGGGDMLAKVHKWAQAEDVQVELTGVDFNPNIIDYAKSNTNFVSGLRFLAQDIYSQTFAEQKYDIVICCLFLHHFKDDELVTLLERLSAQATWGILINDLHRHPVAYYSIKFLTRMFSSSYMVRYDAPLSVLRAFRKHEITALLRKAGVTKFRISWKWAFRWQVLIETKNLAESENFEGSC